MMPWVFIDASFIAHRAMHSTGQLSHEDIPTGVIYGTFETIRKVCFDPRIKSNKVVFFFDSDKSYRRDKYPWYKSRNLKERTPEEQAARSALRDQLTNLRLHILPTIGFPCFVQDGVESDDLIASAAAQFKGSNGSQAQAVIVTADGDLYQCISWATHWYDPIRDRYLDPVGFLNFKGIDASMWGDVKAIAGCDGDGVSGVNSVGEKTAIDYLTNILPKHHKRHANIVSPTGQFIIRRNEELVKLPHRKTKVVTLPTDPVYRPQKFFQWCKRFGVTSYLTGQKLQMWDRFFAGELIIELNSRQKARAPKNQLNLFEKETTNA